MIGARLARLARLSTVLAACSALVLAACGGAAVGGAKSAEPQTETEAPALEPTTIEGAEKEIARAKAQLAAADTRAPGTPSSLDRPADPGRPSPPPEPAPPRAPSAEYSPRASQPTTQDAPKAALGVEDRCASPCRAIASMRRAVTALCRMTGADDHRCVDAKHTLTDSEKRLSSCSC